MGFFLKIILDQKTFSLSKKAWTFNGKSLISFINVISKILKIHNYDYFECVFKVKILTKFIKMVDDVRSSIENELKCNAKYFFLEEF